MDQAEHTKARIACVRQALREMDDGASIIDGLQTMRVHLALGEFRSDLPEHLRRHSTEVHSVSTRILLKEAAQAIEFLSGRTA